MHVTTRSVLSAAAAALVAGAGVLGEPWVTLAALAVALGFAVGWPTLLRLPAPQGSAVVVALGGGGGVLAVSLTRGDPVLRGLPEVVALAVLLAFVNELARSGGRPRLVESVSGGVSGVLLASAAAGWVAALRTPAGVGLVVAGALALFFAAAASAVPFGGWTAAGLTMFAGALGGVGSGVVMAQVGPAAGGADRRRGGPAGRGAAPAVRARAGVVAPVRRGRGPAAPGVRERDPGVRRRARAARLTACRGGGRRRVRLGSGA